MASKESHPIRNGIMATVVGGIILSVIPPLRELSVKFLKWVWSGVVWVGDQIVAEYSLPVWVLLILIFLAFIGLIVIYFEFKTENRSEDKNYTEDMIYGAKWRWGWFGGHISNLWCFCPLN